MDINIFASLFEMGLHPLPLYWNIDTKQAEHYPEHITDVRSGNGKHDLNDVKRWLEKISNANAVALKLHAPFFMFDFDLKNSQDKTIYSQWLQMIEANNEDILRKICIEKTRSGGYHVYAKHPKVSHKKMLAASETGHEVISLYTGGLLSFCAPTPDYEIIHNDFTDIEDLTDDELDLCCAAAIHFNKYIPKESEYVPGEIISYPTEYESVAMQFDKLCTDDLFEQILHMIDLFPVKDSRNKKEKFGNQYYLYHRKGSTAKFSAKVRFDQKRLFLFSASFSKFPNFHTRINDKDRSWRLTPTRILYYIFDKDWNKTIASIKELCQEHEIKIIEQQPITEQPLLSGSRLQFPFDIYPEAIQQFIYCQSIQHEYLAGAILNAVSTAIGNSAVLEAMPGYRVKPILYMAIVAPPGASKTPAINKAFAALEEYDNQLYKGYEEKLVEYKDRLREYEKDKKGNDKPEPPAFPQTLIKDSTIEMVVKILSFNRLGCCVLADELVGFLNRMNQYKAGDEVQKWLEMWSGNSVLLQRITREANKVEDPFCNVMGGIQPGVLESLSRDENQHNGFYHRFLFVYPEPQKKPEWKQVYVPEKVKYSFKSLFINIMNARTDDRIVYTLSYEADEMYKHWFDFKNAYYNRAQNDNVKGIIAKYQDYCLRFALIIQVMEDGHQRNRTVTNKSMERAIRLTEYFLGNMHKALKVLAPETPADKLQGQWETLYKKLGVSFSTDTLVATAATLGIKEASAKSFLRRKEGELFQKIDRGAYEKLF